MLSDCLCVYPQLRAAELIIVRRGFAYTSLCTVQYICRTVIDRVRDTVYRVHVHNCTTNLLRAARTESADM